VPLGVDLELPALLVGLFEERVQQGVASPIGREAGPQVGVTAEGALVDSLVFRPGEGTAPVLQLVDGARGVVAEDLDRVLVTQEVRALDGVVDVGLDRVVVDVAERRGDSSLGRSRVASTGIDLRDHGHVEVTDQLHRGSQPRETRSNDDDVVFVHIFPPGKRYPPASRRFSVPRPARPGGGTSLNRALPATCRRASPLCPRTAPRSPTGPRWACRPSGV
jgi:hypothetical protein